MDAIKATFADIRAEHPGVGFFRELIDTTSFKCYGTQQLTEAEITATPQRFVGFYGRAERVFSQPFEIQRGHKVVVVRASERKPLRCWEHVYAHI